VKRKEKKADFFVGFFILFPQTCGVAATSCRSVKARCLKLKERKVGRPQKENKGEQTAEAFYINLLLPANTQRHHRT
jgi:hypothetical protein